MNPKQFLLIGGVVLVVVGLLGFFALIGPTADNSLFGGFWYFDNYENWAHLLLGVVALVAAYSLGMEWQKYLTMAVGVVALLFGLYSLLISTDFLGAMLQNPADTVLHLVIGVWALWASLMKK